MNKKAVQILSAMLILLTACGEPDPEIPDSPMPTMTSTQRVEYIQIEPFSDTGYVTTTAPHSTVRDMTGTELATTFTDEFGNIYGFTSGDADTFITGTSAADTSINISDIPDVPASDVYGVTTSSQTTWSAPESSASQTAAQTTPGTVPSYDVTTAVSLYDIPIPGSTSQSYNIITSSDTISDTDMNMSLSEKQISDIDQRRISEQNAVVRSSYTNRNVIMHPYSYYSLSEPEKYAYDVIVNAMNSYESDVSFPLSEKITFDDLFNAYQCVYTDEVGLFYIDTLMEYITDQSTGYVKNMHLCYIYTQSQVERMKNEIDTEAEKILSQVTPDMSDHDIVLLIHDSIIKNCTYNTTGNNITNIYGALCDKSAQCQGYTRAFSYLCAKCGIETDIVLGIAAEDHMWNMVKLDGEWYHIDLTWDDPDKKQYPDSVRYDYFCLSTKRISELRTISGNNHDIPEANSEKYEYYIENDLVAYTYDDAKRIIEREAKKVSDSKASTIQFRCADRESYNAISEQLFGNSNDNALSILIGVNETAQNKFYTDSIYHNSNRNTFTIRLFLDYI